MAYMQKPGRAPLKNKNFEALTNGTPLRNHKPGHKDTKTGNEGRSADNIGAKLDKGGNEIITDATTGKNISTNASSRKMNKDAASGKIRKELTGNVNYNKETKTYSAKPFPGKISSGSGYSDSKGNFTKVNNMGVKNNPASNKATKDFNKLKSNYDQKATQQANMYNKRAKNG